MNLLTDLPLLTTVKLRTLLYIILQYVLWHIVLPKCNGYMESWGAPRTTLPVQLNKDLATSDYQPLKLPADLHSFRAQASRRGTWQRLTNEVINAYKSRYNLIQHRRRRPRPAIPQDQPAAEQLSTPPGHDFRRNNIRLLGSPYRRQNPSPLQAFYNLRISTP